MMCAGHESWHPNPGFYYLRGGGPVLDMGPYSPISHMTSVFRCSVRRVYPV